MDEIDEIGRLKNVIEWNLIMARHHPEDYDRHIENARQCAKRIMELENGNQSSIPA